MWSIGRDDMRPGSIKAVLFASIKHLQNIIVRILTFYSARVSLAFIFKFDIENFCSHVWIIIS